jgi:hypothetical protein
VVAICRDEKIINAPLVNMETERLYRNAQLIHACHKLRQIANCFIKYKNPLTERVFVFLSVLVTRPGFEPRQAESESAVLPLYYRAIFESANLKKK